MKVLESIYIYLKNSIQNITTQQLSHEIFFTLNTDTQKQIFGDITTNAAMIIAKQNKKSPRIIAEEICSKIDHLYIKKIEIAGPGFINIFLTIEAIQDLARELFTEKDAYFILENEHCRYNIEFVSANPTGPLHLGHGRNGILGDVLANILIFAGNHVTREHYINDAGSQIQKLGESLKIRIMQLQGSNITIPEDGYHGEYLINLAQNYINDHETDINHHDIQHYSDYAYNKLLQELHDTLQLYGIKFDVWFSEKTLHPQHIENALALLHKNQTTYLLDNALWFKSTAYGDDKDRVLQKADGSFTYAAADAAYLLNKASRGFNKLIYILGQDHHSYPQRLNGLAQALNLKNISIECILYQLVSIKSGTEHLKLSKRAGRIIELKDVIEVVGVDVARFFYLNRKADAHLELDIKLALNKTDENPVYYLQYAYVRTKSILQKAQEHTEFSNICEDDAYYLEEEDKLLIKKIASFKDLLENICKNYQVHLVTYYLLEFAHIFHNYYHHNKIIDPENINKTRARLLLTIISNDMFTRILKLIGISQPNTM